MSRLSFNKSTNSNPNKEVIKEYSNKIKLVFNEIQKAIIGQEEIINKVLIGLISQGHILIEGVPGLAKTLLIKTLSDALNLSFVRLQFTPDLLPADIIGTKILENYKFKTVKGPIFHNFVLADEINRAPPKVQSALLEAMQEKQVSIQGETIKLNQPFLVLATQNPIESEGTYQLPEAQLDRFMFKLLIDYPNKLQEKQIILRYSNQEPTINKILKKEEILEIQELTKQIYVDESIVDYVVEIIDATRKHNKKLELSKYIDYGASPRASLWLIKGAKANALINSRNYVLPDDVKFIAHDVLRHRIILNYEADADNITPDDVIDEILKKVKTP